MRTSSRNVALLLFDEVELLDVAAVAQVLSAAGRQWNWRPFRIASVALRAGSIATRNQVTLTADFDFDTCPVPEIVVVPGGYGARRSGLEGEHAGWLARVGALATHLVGIGAGVGLLGKAGLLRSSRVAAQASAAEWLAPLDPGMTIDTSARVVVDGRIFTAGASAAALDISLSLVSAILGEKQARGVAEGLGHEWVDGSRAPDKVRIDIV